jgi:hypothetical protein
MNEAQLPPWMSLRIKALNADPLWLEQARFLKALVAEELRTLWCSTYRAGWPR